MNKGTEVILTWLIAPTVFELLKIFVIWIINKIEERSLPYSMSGYWCTYHEMIVNNQTYSCYELLKIKQQGSKLVLCIYQLTNDNRFYLYKGKGYIRGAKVSFSYEEVNSKFSSSTGNVSLLRKDILQHTPRYEGVFSEFIRENENCTCSPYILCFLDLGWFDKMMITIFKSRYIKNYMEKERFLKNYENRL